MYVVIPPIDLLCVYRITGAVLSYTKRVRGKSRTHTHKTPAYMHSVCARSDCHCILIIGSSSSSSGSSSCIGI